MKPRKFHYIYLLAGLYIAAVYFVPVLFFVLSNQEEVSGVNLLYFVFVPIILGVINLIIVCTQKNKIGRERLLNCTVLIKYLLIPFYIMGGLIIAVFFLLIFTPLVFMAFLSPVLILTFSIMGWLFMIGAAPFSIAYIVESAKEKVHGKVLCVITSILQFFFTADVISIMILALKEKKCVKVTVATMIILGLGIIGVVLAIAVLIMKIMIS